MTLKNLCVAYDLIQVCFDFFSLGQRSTQSLATSSAFACSIEFAAPVHLTFSIRKVAAHQREALTSSFRAENSEDSIQISDSQSNCLKTLIRTFSSIKIGSFADDSRKTAFRSRMRDGGLPSYRRLSRQYAAPDMRSATHLHSRKGCTRHLREEEAREIYKVRTETPAT
jgi:hypothetical protein